MRAQPASAAPKVRDVARTQPPPPDASVDLGEEARHAAGGEFRDVVDGRLPLLGSEAGPERVHVLEGELGDALVGDRAAVRRRDALRDFESLQAGDRLCKRGGRLRVVALEGVRILRGVRRARLP